MKAAENKCLSTQSLSQSDTFMKNGFTNWKTALENGRGFKRHAESCIHKEAIVRYSQHKPTNPGNLLDYTEVNHLIQQRDNRLILQRIFSNAKFLGKQGLAFRGNWDNEQKCEVNSNFYQLLLLRSEDEPKILNWLDQNDKYISPKLQNEIIDVSAL